VSRKSLVPNNVLTGTADPSTPTLRAGDTYFNTSTMKLRVHTGSAWTDVIADAEGLIWMSVGP
jgi:hypothetical protein